MAGLHAPRLDARVAAAGAVAGLAVVSATGLVAQKAFTQQSSVKYAATIAAPLVLLALLSVARPVLVAVGLLLAAAPFGGLEVTFRGVSISLVTALAALAFLVTLAQPTAERPARSRLADVALLCMVLLAVPAGANGVVSGAVRAVAVLFVAGYLVARAARERDGLEIVLGSVLVGAAVQAVLALYQVQTKEVFDLYGGAGQQVFGSGYFFAYGDTFRPIGTLADPISLGNVLALALPGALVLALHARRPLLRILAAAAGALVAVGLIVTLSRMSWFAAVGGLLVTATLLPTRTRLNAFLALGLAGALCITIAAAVAGDSLVDRFDSALNPTSSTVSTSEGDKDRLEYWGAARDVFESQPITGAGFGHIGEAFEQVGLGRPGVHAHSTYLQLLAEAGILGVLALVVALLALARDVGVGIRSEQRPWAAAAGGMAVGLLICWLTDVTVRYESVAVVMGAVFGLASAVSRSGRTPAAGAAGRSATAAG